jgi:hypothetical protein
MLDFFSSLLPPLGNVDFQTDPLPLHEFRSAIARFCYSMRSLWGS